MTHLEWGGVLGERLTLNILNYSEISKIYLFVSLSFLGYLFAEVPVVHKAGPVITSVFPSMRFIETTTTMVLIGMSNKRILTGRSAVRQQRMYSFGNQPSDYQYWYFFLGHLPTRRHIQFGRRKQQCRFCLKVCIPRQTGLRPVRIHAIRSRNQRCLQ